MAGANRVLEMDFELALTGNLEEIYGLQVRVEGDPLNRRRSGYTNLCFRYEYPSKDPTDAKVEVTIAGRKDSAHAFQVDLTCADSIEHAAACCEDLAFAIGPARTREPGKGSERRREED